MEVAARSKLELLSFQSSWQEEQETAKTTFEAGQLALASELCYYLLLDFDFRVCLFFV